MKKEKKTTIINNIAEQLKQSPHFYVTDISELNAEKTHRLRKLCFEKKVKLLAVKNTLFGKALKQNGFDEPQLHDTLKGSTAVMFCDVANAPAKLIREFQKSTKGDKPEIKSAYAQECLFTGKNSIEELVNIKSREELIGDIAGLLQSPARNVISALLSGGQKLSGIMKTLSERPE